MKNKRIQYAVAIIAMLCAGAGFYGYHEYHRKAEDIRGIKSSYNVEAIQIIREFSTSEIVANEKYLSKIVTVSGRVKSIDVNEGYYTLSLGDTAGLSSVRCSIDSLHTQVAISVQVGATAVIKGYCSGFNSDDLLGNDVVLSRCIIETFSNIKPN